MLDMATGAAQKLIPGFAGDDDFYVPFSYGRVLVTRPVPANFLQPCAIACRGKQKRDL